MKDDVIGEMVFGRLQHVKRLKTEDDWRNDESMAAATPSSKKVSTGFTWPPALFKITAIRGFRPVPSTTGPDKASQEHDGVVCVRQRRGRVTVLLMEIPSMLKGLRLSKLYGRKGIITFESNGVIVLARGRTAKLIFPGFRDIRGYQAMYATSCAIVNGAVPKMSVEQAIEDQRLMDQIYLSLQQCLTRLTSSSLAASWRRQHCPRARGHGREDPDRRARRLHSAGRPQLESVVGMEGSSLSHHRDVARR